LYQFLPQNLECALEIIIFFINKVLSNVSFFQVKHKCIFWITKLLFEFWKSIHIIKLLTHPPLWILQKLQWMKWIITCVQWIYYNLSIIQNIHTHLIKINQLIPNKLLNASISKMTHYSLTSAHERLFLINEIRTSLSWLVAKINALGVGKFNWVISDYFRNFYHFSVNSSLDVIFLFLHYQRKECF